MDQIFTRRSIRAYTNKPVEKEKIELIIKAGMYAPSAKNSQPWYFVVITDREKLDKTPEIQPYTQMSKLAQVAILVCAKPEASPMYFQQDIGAVVENMLIEVNHLGLGACWCGVYPGEAATEGFKKLCNLPDDILPIAYVPIGYPDTSTHLPRPHGRRYDESRIHYNEW